METIEQKARELTDVCTPTDAGVYNVLVDMGRWYERKIKDYLVRRVESLDEDVDFKEKQIIGGIYKDLFENENNTI